MVQVIENRAEFEGRLMVLRNDETRPGHKLATIDVRTVRPVDTYPNMFAEAAGTRVDVVVPDAAAGSLRVGGNIRCRVRRTGPATVFAESCLAIDP